MNCASFLGVQFFWYAQERKNRHRVSNCLRLLESGSMHRKIRRSVGMCPSFFLLEHRTSTDRQVSTSASLRSYLGLDYVVRQCGQRASPSSRFLLTMSFSSRFSAVWILGKRFESCNEALTGRALEVQGNLIDEQER